MLFHSSKSCRKICKDSGHDITIAFLSVETAKNANLVRQTFVVRYVSPKVKASCLMGVRDSNVVEKIFFTIWEHRLFLNIP